MPKLSATTRRKLKYLPMAGAAAHGVAALACWNWALTGFRAIQNNPDELFNFVTFGFPWTHPWCNVPANQNRLNALRNAWAPFNGGPVNGAALAELQRVNQELTRLACELNGLTPVRGRTPYEVVMHYDPTLADGTLNGPNYTHWWLRIDGGGTAMHNDGLEVFPGAPNITIRRPEYSVHNNCRVFVNELHQDHVTRINTVLTAVIAGNHPAAVAHGPWVDRNQCAICNTHVTTGLTRHHCRCCGRTVCSACSPETRAVLLNGRVPAHKLNRPATNPPHRVCLYC